MTTGECIKAARKNAGLTQKELGDRLGIAYQALSQWENGLRNPKYETLQRIAVALQIDIHVFMRSVFSAVDSAPQTEKPSGRASGKSNIRKVSTSGMDRAAWLDLRRKSIGGSDAAGIIGLSKWSSPMSVWADKLGLLPERPDTEPMRVGRDLEDYVASRWMEATKKKVRHINAVLYNDAYPFAHANVDRLVRGENAGLECKTTSTLNVRQFQGVEFPEQYYAQCVHYMAVTGADRWYLGVLVFGRGFFEFTLERDQAEIDALMKAEAEFWEYVQKDAPPPADGHPATSETLQDLYQDTVDEEIELFGREGLLREWADIKEQQKALDQRKTEIENIIKQDLQEHERGSCAGFSVTWKPQQRRTFQTERFEKDHPDIPLAPYYKVSKSRPLRINIDKEDSNA